MSVPSLKFSVAIATMNAAETVAQAIESVIKQTAANWELLVVDGGSTDGTLEIVRSFSGYISVVISEPDQGIYDAWNKAVKVFTGDYICFLGADDVFRADAVEKMSCAALSAATPDYISGQVQLNYPSGVSRIIGLPLTWSRMRRYMCVAHVGSAHHKDLFQRFGRFDHTYRITGDYEFLLRVGAEIRVAYVPTVLCEMTWGGISSNRYAAVLESHRAKRSHRTVNFLFRTFDFLEASIKFFGRKAVNSLVRK